MKVNVQIATTVPGEAVDVRRLAGMPAGELQQLYKRIFGSAIPSGNSDQARRKIAWHLQAEREGCLPESARRHALAIARGASLRIHMRHGSARAALPHANVTSIVSDHDSRLPMPGSIIVKDYRGKTVVVRVLDAGFEYDGKRFTSLSAIAKQITGTKWNGFLFFGLAKDGHCGH